MQQPYVLSRQQLRRYEIAAWIFSAAGDRPYVEVALVGLFDQYDAAGQQILADELDDLESLGWIGNRSTPLSFEGYSCQLTAAGAETVEELQRLRSDRDERRKAARDVVLRDLLAQKRHDPHRTVTFYGAPFTPDERDEARRWLYQRKFIGGQLNGAGDVYVAWISDLGEDYIEEGWSVNDRNTHSRSSVPTTVITGNNNTVAHTGAGDITQTVTNTTITAAEQDEVLKVVTTYEQVRTLLMLAPDQMEAADAAAAELKVLAVQPGLPKKRLLPALTVLAAGVATGASEGVGGMLLDAIQHLTGLLQ